VRRGRALAIGFGALFVVAAIFFGPRLSTRAQVTENCTPAVLGTVGSGSVLTCVLTTGGLGNTGTTTTAGVPSVAPGGTLTISLTNPVGAAFVSPFLSGIPNGCFLTPVPPPPVMTLTVDCAVSGEGIPFETNLTETVQLNAPPATPFVTETVTYNANGSGAPSGTGASSTTGLCSAYPLVAPFTSTCQNTPGQTTTAGGTLTLTISAPAATPAATSTSNGLCTPILPIPPFSSSCTNTPGQVTRGPGTLTFAITAPPGFDITGFPVGMPPSSEGPCPLDPASPSPTLPAPQVFIEYDCAPGESAAVIPYTINVETDDPFPGGVATEQTTSVNMATAGGLITMVTAPPAAGSCPNTNVGPLSAPQVAITYGCSAGESAPAATILVPLVGNGPPGGIPTETTVSTNPVAGASSAPVVSTGVCAGALPPVVGASVACTNLPGAAGTFAGGALTLTVAAAPGQTISITAAPAAVGGCPLTTNLPTSVSNPGGVVSVTYTCGPGQATGTPSVTVTVTNENGAPGTPSELTTVSTVSVTTGVPAPTITTVTFAIGMATATPITGETPTGMELTADPEVTVPNQEVTFTAVAMTPNFVGTATANIAQFRFAFGDGGFQLVPAQFSGNQESATATHVYLGPGVFIAVVQAVDSTGEASTASTTVTVKPDVSYLPLYGPLPPGLATAGTSVKVTLTIASSQIVGTSDQVAFTWTAVTQVNPAQSYSYSLPQSNGGQTPQSLAINWGDGSQAQSVPVTNVDKTLHHTYTQPGQFTATLTATDTLGNSGTGSAEVYLPAFPAQAGGGSSTATETATPSPTPGSSPASSSSPPQSGPSSSSTSNGSSPSSSGSGSAPAPSPGSSQSTAYLDPPTGTFYVVLAFCAYDTNNQPAANESETLDFIAGDGTDLGTTSVSMGSEGCFSGNVQPDGSGKMTMPVKIVSSDSNGASYTYSVTPGMPSVRSAVGPIH